jgi:uncharacterized protein
MAMRKGPQLDVAPVVPTEWRLLCRQCAAAQAAQEGRKVWGVAQDAPIPFNQRWEHVQDVVRHALWLSQELGADVDVAEAAAWLHDIRKEEPDHGVAGAAAAIRTLANSDFPAAKIEFVADAIRHHEGLYRPEGALPLEPLTRAILWDADKLPKLGVRALAFNLSTTYSTNKSLAQRYRHNREYVTTVLQRTVESMNTAPARRLAERRYDDMVAVLETWAREETETAL